MDFFENDYFAISRTLMVWIGQWPYDTSYVKHIRRIVVSFFFLSAVNCLIARLVTADFDLDVYVETISSSLICVLCFTKYCTWWINGEMMKGLLEYIKHDWSILKKEEEMNIIQQYMEYARLISLLYMSCILGGIGIFSLLPLVPRILDIILPLNESRPLRHPLEIQYPVDSQKYFYPILMHMVLAILILHMVACATDCIFMYFVMHGCASFAIFGERLEQLFNDIAFPNECAILSNCGTNPVECKFCIKIGRCVQFHRKIIKYIDSINASYVQSYLLQLLLAVLILTALLLRLYDKLTPLKNMSEVLVSAIHVCGLIVIIFLNIYPAQMLMDTSADNFFQAYCSRWYTAPLPAQKLLVILLRKCMEPCRLTAANVVTASVQIFGTIVHTSLSYFTVLYSMK